MRWKFVMAGAGVVTAVLAGWVTFAGAQPPVPGVPGEAPPALVKPVDVPPPPPGQFGDVPPPPLSSNPAAMPPGPPGAVEAPPPAIVPPTAVTSPPPSLSGGLEPKTTEGPKVETPAAPTRGDESRVSVPPTVSMRPAAFDPQPIDPGVTTDNPSGRQEPSVSIEWVGSPLAKVGQLCDYTLMVKNTCNVAVQNVSVRVRMPVGLSVEATEPKVNVDNGMMVWEVGTMPARQEKAISLKLKAESRGDLVPQAWVTFTGACALRIKVREPKLLVKVNAPEKVMVGDPAQFTLTVSNPGDGSADAVKIHANLSEGLEHARGNKIDFEIGSLAAGESRNVTLLCATRVGGVQKMEASANADGGLSAKDAGSLNVIMPRLDIQVLGPRLRYLERKARYMLRVTNPGDAPATNVTVADIVPAGFKVLAASHGGRHDFQTRTVSWFLGEIGPGQTREVEMEVQAINVGLHNHKATAVGARGLRAEADLVTKVEGVAAMLVELVDTEDPIEAGGETGYEVRITNTGSKTETGIKVVATIPEKMQFTSAQGPVRYKEEGKTVVFDTIEKLAPRADAIIRLHVKALEPGVTRMKIQVSSDTLTEPVIKEEPTRIYSDAPEAPVEKK